MKKILIMILVLLLILGGLFVWKGGHHAIALADILEEWADADIAEQTLTVQIQKPGYVTDPDSDRIKPTVEQLHFSAKSFWLEYADRDVFGLEVEGMTAFLLDHVLYMDTGRAYTLPKLDDLKKYAHQLSIGLLLHGRVTKNTNTYSIDMKTQELELHISAAADTALSSLNLTAITSDDTVVTAFITTTEPVRRTMPQEVLDAIVCCKMEPPISITAPLDALKLLVPWLEQPEAEARFSVDCGILDVEGSGRITMEDGKLVLTNSLGTMELKSLEQLKDISPAAAGLLLLRNAEFLPGDTGSEFRIRIPTEEFCELAQTLVPEFRQLPITWAECQMVLRIPDHVPPTIHVQTEGTIPLVLVEIPLTFTADFTLN